MMCWGIVYCATSRCYIKMDKHAKKMANINKYSDIAKKLLYNNVFFNGDLIEITKYILVNNVDNLFRKNMMNVKPAYKKHAKEGTYDRDYDSYCSLIPWSEFISNIGKYVDLAFEKRNALYKYNIVKRM